MNFSKTTVYGAVAFLAVFFTQLWYQIDGDEETVPNWNLVVAAAGVGAVGLSARDNKVSDEKAGAKPDNT